MKVENTTPFLFGARSCLRRPGQPEMTAIARVKLTLAPRPEPFRSKEVDPATLASLREEAPEEAAKLERALVLLGQGALEADRYREGDHRREGEVIYPSDFADWKPSAEVTLRGSCCLRTPQARAEVELAVGAWSKKLVAVGHRVMLDRIAGGKASDPQPFTRLAVDYAHAYGGPGFANNPDGKGHLGKVASEEDLYQPPRSERSRVMPSDQLPNVELPGGRMERDGLPAGFGPISPTWAFRAGKRGKQYDARWLAERAPGPAADFDPTYFFAAPPDQVLPGFLRGDETVRLKNLHADAAELSFQLPGLRPRVFVRDTAGRDTEVAMHADTLHVDTEEGAVYLTWRGLAPARDLELSDKAFALVVTEPLGAEQPAARHLARLDAFAKDPIGLHAAMPAGAAQAAEAWKKLEEADDAELDAILSREPNALEALLAHLGPVADEIRQQGGAAFEAANDAAGAEVLREKVKQAIRRGQGGQAASPAVAQAAAAAGAGKLAELRGHVGGSAALDDAAGKLQAVAAAGASSAAGTGPSFAGQDLTGRDLSGQSLAGACFDGAVLDGASLRGAVLTGASFKGAQLHKTDLSGADLTGADLTMATLHGVVAVGAKLAKARLDMVQLRKCNLAGADLTGARGSMINVSECDLSSVKGQGIELSHATFDTTRLERADLSGARLSSTRFRGCSGAEMNLGGAELAQSGFKGSDLRRVRARGVKGEQTVWLETTLEGGDFGGARLPKALFQGAKAARTSFKNADLSEGRFDEATLDEASFEGANLRSAVLRKASLARTSFVDASLFAAVFSETAIGSCDLRGAKTASAVFGGAATGGRP